MDKSDFQKGVLAFSIFSKEVLKPLLITLEKACDSLINKHYIFAQKQYFKEFKKLPGSNKTKRLRKKREKIVTKWFFDCSK